MQTKLLPHSPLPHSWRLLDRSLIAPPRIGRRRPNCSLLRLTIYAALTAYFFLFLYFLFFPTHRLFGFS